MNNAAIITFRRSILPKLLKTFAKPVVQSIVEVGRPDSTIRIHMLECPVFAAAEDNRKLFRYLRDYCHEKDIHFFIGKNIEYYHGSGLEYLEREITRGNTEEIKGIKGLAVLIKLSDSRKESLLKNNMLFIGSLYSYSYISTLSEEAAGVFIYEQDKMDSCYKKEIYERLMEDKGISAVFTKDLARALTQCKIISADASVELEEFRDLLSGKIIIGNNPVSGEFEKISRILLWSESLESLTDDNILVSFNDEMLGIMNYYCKERSYRGFLKGLHYIGIS